LVVIANTTGDRGVFFPARSRIAEITRRRGILSLVDGIQLTDTEAQVERERRLERDDPDRPVRPFTVGVSVVGGPDVIGRSDATSDRRTQ